MEQERVIGYLAEPSGGAGPGVLVLHAWWGLNDTIRDTCNQLAGAGFTAFAPDLYHGRTATTPADAEALAQALDENHLQAKTEIAAAAAFLRQLLPDPERGVAVVGFSLGAYYALDLAAHHPASIDRVVLFYGTGADAANPRAAYLGHFAEDDPYEPAANVDHLEEALQRAGCPVTFHRYAGTGHWFCEPDRTDAYQPAAARVAWERTLAFLRDAGER